MKNLKLLGVAVTAALVCSAAVGVGSASATVLCKTAAKPCTSDYAAGTKITAKLPFTQDMHWSKEVGSDTCYFSSLAGQTANTGGVGSKVVVPLSELSWTSCEATWETLKPGTIEIEVAKEGAQNVVTLKGTEFRVGGCTYSAGTGIQAGWLTSSASESSAAQLWISPIVPKIAGSILCNPWVKWEAIYEVSAPKPLYVAAS